MKKGFAFTVLLVLVLCVVLSLSASAEEAKPGETIMINVPFASKEAIVALQVDYTISNGLQFVSGSCSGMMGSATKSRAVMISLAGVSSGTVVLELLVKPDATGDQSVAITSVMGADNVDYMEKKVGSEKVHSFEVLASVFTPPVASADATSQAIATSSPQPSSSLTDQQDPPSATIAYTPKTDAASVVRPLALTESPPAVVSIKPTVSLTVSTTHEPGVFSEADLTDIEQETGFIDLTTGQQKIELVLAYPDGFEATTPAAGKIPEEYTAIRIPDFPHALYAFTDREGRSRARIYGRLDGRKGIFEVELLAKSAGELLVLEITVVGNKPIRDNKSSFARAVPVALDKTAIPAGYEITPKWGLLSFTNLFGKKEYRILGAIPGIANAYYASREGRPRVGALAINLEGDEERMIDSGEKYHEIPREYRNGYATRVFIMTSNGHKLSVWTDKPLLYKEKMK